MFDRKSGLALWKLGFRPFFLLGVFAGLISMALWMGAFSGRGLVHVDVLWHAHEMIYGFAVAIIIGFLYTASKNWTGLPGIRGPKLALTTAVWLVGRMAFLIPGLPPGVAAVGDLAFLPVASVFLASYLWRKGQRHNLIFLILLGGLWLGNLGYHLDRLGIVPGAGRAGIYLSVHLIVAIVVIVAGRVIPFFSERALNGYARRPGKWLNIACTAASIGFALASMLPSGSVVKAVAAAVAAAVTGLYLGLMFDRRVLRIPILWILYAGYAWLVVGYGLAFFAALDFLPQSTALHAFTAGSISTMIVGMVSRVSLGHTGRPIVASRLTTVSFVLILASGLVRTTGPILFPYFYAETILWSGALWVLAMAALLTRYMPLLLRPRADQRAG